MPGKDGHTPVITIVDGYWYIDGVNSFQLAQGSKGDTGNGISSITLTSTQGLVDTYTITFTNGEITTFTVTNGADGDTPHIGENGNWWIGGLDTGVMAKNTSYELMYNRAAVSIDWYDATKDVYYIDNVYDFNGIAYLVNEMAVTFEGKTLILTSDIDLFGVSYNSIGNYTNGFYGILDGNCHSVYGIDRNENNTPKVADVVITTGELGEVKYTGLFLSNYGTVKNLIIRDFNVDIELYGGYESAVVLPSILVYNNYGTVENVSAYGSSRLISDAYTNGNVRFVENNFGTIKDCVLRINIDISSDKFVHIAPLSGTNYGEISDCEVSGNINAELYGANILDHHISGMVINAMKGSVLSGCVSSVRITVSGNANNGTVSGFVSRGDYSLIDGCAFTGNIEVNVPDFESYYWNISGIVGWIDLSSEYGKTVVLNCENSGTIRVNAEENPWYSQNLSQYIRIGGIIANLTGNADVLNNTFSGSIFANVESESENIWLMIGGIIGCNDYGIRTLEINNYKTSVTECASNGEIAVNGYRGNTSIGGIVGYSSLSTHWDYTLIDTSIHKITYELCSFSGSINIKNYKQKNVTLGGIAGDASSVEIKNCDVYGTVIADDIKSVRYGEIVGEALYSFLLDGGVTKTRIITCSFGNTVYSGGEEYHPKHLAGMTSYTELVLPIDEGELSDKENYQLLEGKEKELYLEIYYWAVELGNYEFLRYYYNNYRWDTHYGMIDIDKYGVSVERALEIFNLVVFDTPEFIHLSLTNTVVISMGDEHVLGIDINEYYTSTDREDNPFDDMQQIAMKLSSIESATEGLSDYEKIKYVFDFVLANCEYAFDQAGNPIANDDTFSLVGALINSQAVCEGYALALNYLCDNLGINSYVITSSELDHAWNILELDGEWYYVDVTYSDTSDVEFFLMGSKSFSETHSSFDELVKYPEASEQDYVLS